MPVHPYLFFNGRCEEAADFYRGAIGAEIVMMMRFKECPDPAMRATMTPGTEDKVMHMAMRVGETELMASDGRCQGEMSFQGFALSLYVKDQAEAARKFAALGDGGAVQMPLTKTFYSPCFGIIADRFGMTWMVMVPQAPQ